MSWENLSVAAEGDGSSIVSFPSLSPFEVRAAVTKRYTLHVGREARLTFLGNRTTPIVLEMMECRRDSKKLHGSRFQFLMADPTKRYVVPAGVAYRVKLPPGVFVVDSYRTLLPSPGRWREQRKIWDPMDDSFRFGLGVAPVVEPNDHEASMEWHSVLDEFIRVEDEWEGLVGIRGVGVLRRRETARDQVSFRERRPWHLQFGGKLQPSYCIRLAQEERFTFVGLPDDEVIVELVDCRKESPTTGEKMVRVVRPSLSESLVIPAGVGYRFELPSDVVALNQPRIFLRKWGELPEVERMEWSIGRRFFPRLSPNGIAVDDRFYSKYARRLATRSVFSSREWR